MVFYIDDWSLVFFFFIFNLEREIESESDKFKILMKGGGWVGSLLILLKRVIK